MQLLHAVWSWCLANPLIVWPVVTFLVTAIFGEADKYAKNHPTFARFLRLLNAAGLSAPGLLKAIKGKLLPPVATMMVVVSVLCCLPFLALTACPTAGPVVQPAATLTACITSDALAGKSLADIVKDCGADVPSVVIAIVNAIDPGVLASRAHAEALTLRASLYMQDGGAAAPSPGK